jgi:hypothetical protein
MLRTRVVFGFVGVLVTTLIRDDAFSQVLPGLRVPANVLQPGALASGPTPTATAASGMTQTPTPRPSPANVGHFMSYGVKAAKDTASFVPLGPVSLPRLGGGPYDLLKVGRLLLPADKNSEGVRDDATHLLEYRLKPRKGAPKFAALADVRVMNQCSDVLVALTKPVAALVPTAKNLASPVTAPVDPAVDHFLCFDAKLQKKGPGGAALPKFPKGVQVQVVDQFQSRRYELTKPTRLCAPTDKSGAPVFLKGGDKGKPAALEPATVQHADEHLLCYKAKLATTTVAQAGCGPATPGDKGTKIPKQAKHAPRTGVFVANQLGALRLDTTKEVELCIPSSAELPGGAGSSLLPGDPQQLVSAATFDLLQAPEWTDAEITVDASSGARILRTRLGVFFTDDATVRAANALLARIRGEIIMMLAGPPYVIVRIPDPGSLDALEALAADIEEDPAVASVSLDVIPETAILPPDFPRPDGDVSQKVGLSYIDHLLQARAAAAWNLRGAVKAAPALVLADNFGAGVPAAAFNAEYPVTGDFAVGKPDRVLHGYQVLGVIAAKFGRFDEGGPENCLDAPPGPASADCATGIYPGPLAARVRAADGQKLSWNAMELRVLEAVEAFAPARVVVNASIYNALTVGNDFEARRHGQRWIDLVRKKGLEAQFLLVVAAGNVSEQRPSVRDALTSSSFTAAALHTDLPRLSNVIVVDNRRVSRFPFRPGGFDESSKRGGHLSACGTDVWTVVPPPPAIPDGWTGTSYSSPLVAGVAAYAWAIAPELTVEQVRDLIVRNAQPQDGATPALDAYATLLDIDNVTNIEGMGEFPVRRALLNFISLADEVTVNADDVVNFFLFRNDRTPDDRRYRKEDLRAAFEPQTDSVRFDLDASGTFEKVSVHAGSHQVHYDEEMVNTDADIVCHSAFSATGPYDLGSERIDPGRDRCCKYYKQIGRLPPEAMCFDCPARRAARLSAVEEEEPKPVGIWRLSTPDGLQTYLFFLLEDGTVMTTLPTSGIWQKTGTWTSMPHEVDGEILYYDVRMDPCPGVLPSTAYGFEGTWSLRPVTDCFGVTSCFDGDGCPAMKGMLSSTNGTFTSPPFPVDSHRAQGIDGWEPLSPPLIHECHGGCFEWWWRTGLLACAPVGGHCLETAAPTCGGVCLPGSMCIDVGGSCTCVTED